MRDYSGCYLVLEKITRSVANVIRKVIPTKLFCGLHVLTILNVHTARYIVAYCKVTLWVWYRRLAYFPNTIFCSSVENAKFSVGVILI